MTTIDNSKPHKHEFLSQAGSWWRQGLFLGIIGLGLFLLFAPGEKEPSPTDKPGNSVARQAPAVTQPSGVQKTSLGLADSHFALGRPPVNPPLEDHWPAGRRPESAAQPIQPPPQHVRELDALVAQFKNTKELTPEGAKDMKRLLREVRKQGADAVPAIRDFLRSQADVDFDKLSGGEQAEQHTLRQAMFDTLRQIGGDVATAVSLEQLRTTQAPAEIAMLARNLEEAAPGMYRDEALRAANNALQQVLAVSKDPLEVRPLFETLRELGGAEAVTTLDQFPANADMVQYLRNKDTTISPTVRTYALIALAGLPDGEGVSGLAVLAADPNVPVEHRPAESFQMLAQASADTAKAGKALVELAQAGQIPDRAWSAVADALAGKQLQFPSQISGGTLPGTNEADLSGVDAPFVRAFYDDKHNVLYEERSVSGDWSAKQVRQQLALIDNLLGATHSPAAAQALQQARATLQGKGH